MQIIHRTKQIKFVARQNSVLRLPWKPWKKNSTTSSLAAFLEHATFSGPRTFRYNSTILSRGHVQTWLLPRHVKLADLYCIAVQPRTPPPPPTPATKKIEQLSLHGVNLLADSETQPSYLSPHSEGVIFNLQNTREQSVIIFSDEIIKTIMNKTERYSLPILMFSASKLISAYG